MAELPDHVTDGRGMVSRGKGSSIYTIISSQAGAASDALLRALAATKLDEFKEVISIYLEEYDKLLDLTKDVKDTKGLETFMSSTKANLINDGKFLIDAWKAGLGLQMGTAYMGLIETYKGYPQLMNMFQVEKLDASLRPVLERYWLSKYTPTAPDMRLAFSLLMHKQISRSEFNQYAEWEGWASKWHDKLYETLTRAPDMYLAFTMYKRGILTWAEFKECLSIAGFDEGYHDQIYLGMHRRLNFRQLMSLADYVELPDIWVREVLRAEGMLEGDINYVAPAIQKRPLREEIRSVVGRYLWQYQIGRISKDTLKGNLQALGLLPKELELNMLWGELRYQDELLDEKVEILEMRCEKGDITTEEEAKDALVALGILEEKANLMAELWAWKYNLA